jgi:hypothetical protein
MRFGSFSRSSSGAAAGTQAASAGTGSSGAAGRQPRRAAPPPPPRPRIVARLQEAAEAAASETAGLRDRVTRARAEAWAAKGDAALLERQLSATRQRRRPGRSS